MNLCDIKGRIDAFMRQAEIDDLDISYFRGLLNWIRGMADGLRQATEEEIKSAYRQYGSVDVQVDGDAMTCETPNGVWVQAWVYIYPVEVPDA